jgi:hypothetical protein
MYPAFSLSLSLSLSLSVVKVMIPSASVNTKRSARTVRKNGIVARDESNEIARTWKCAGRISGFLTSGLPEARKQA